MEAVKSYNTFTPYHPNLILFTHFIFFKAPINLFFLHFFPTSPLLLIYLFPLFPISRILSTFRSYPTYLHLSSSHPPKPMAPPPPKFLPIVHLNYLLPEPFSFALQFSAIFAHPIFICSFSTLIPSFSTSNTPLDPPLFHHTKKCSFFLISNIHSNFFFFFSDSS